MPPSPRGRANVPATQPSGPTSVVPSSLTEEMRRQLLQEQANALDGEFALPQIKIMREVSLFEFGDNQETAETLNAVVIHFHPRNTLWDRPFDEEPPEDDPNARLPACSAADGRTGRPREGFRHAALDGAVALGTENVACETCPYNKWESAHLIGGASTSRRKACNNNRSVYLLIPGREVPFELILPPTSIIAWDEYIAALIAQGVVMQTCWTRLALERQTRGRLVWSQVTAARGDFLTEEQFGVVMAKRAQFASTMGLNITRPAAATATVRADTPPPTDAEVETHRTPDELPDAPNF